MKKHTMIAAAALAAMLTVQPTFAADENNAPKDSPAAQKRAVDQPAEAARQATGDKSALPAAQPPPEGTAQPAAAREDATPAAAGQAAAATISKDQDFLMNAASGNLFEIQSGQLAQQKSQDDSVKQLAQRLVQDHQQAQQKLQQAAQAKNMDVPQQLSPVHQAKLQKLQKYQGRDFDKHYLAMQTGGHVSNILMYRDAAQMLQDQGLKQYASQTLQHLEAHYQAIAQAAGWSGEARTAGSHQHGTGTTGSGTTGTGTTGSGSGSGTGTGAGTGTGGTGTGGGSTGGGATGGTGTSGSGAGTGAGTPGSNRNTTDNPPGTSR